MGKAAILVAAAVWCIAGAVAARAPACQPPYAPWRVPLSPYPTPTAPVNSPAASIVTFNSTAFSATQLLTLQTLQGALSRTKATLFETGGMGDTKNWWLADLEARFGVKVDISLSTNFAGILKLYRSSVTGFVLANIPDNVLGALSYAAAASGAVIVVAPVDAPTVKAAGIAQVADATTGAITPQSVLTQHGLGKGALTNRTVNLQVCDRCRVT